MTAYLKKIDPGYPGALSRAHEGGHNIKTEIAGDGTQFQFGQPLLLDPATGTVNLFDHVPTGDQKFWGFSVRPFPKQGQATLLNEADPSYEGELVSVLQRGYMTVKLSAGSLAVKRGEIVNISTTASGSGATALTAGDILGNSAPSGASTEPIRSAMFNADAQPGDVVEIFIEVIIDVA